ncbi:MAG: hypothetical protein QJR08_06565 [Bacillota bacterium]|nr:hypothetical protein [Bacillota bacterium]
MAGVAGILVPGGSGDRGAGGKIRATPPGSERPPVLAAARLSPPRMAAATPTS